MTPPIDPGFLGLGKVVDWLIAGVSALAGVVWKLFDHRMKKVERVAEAALPREEFEAVRQEDRQESRDDRKEIRDDMKTLSGEQRALRELMDVKMDGLRKDVNAGFESIRMEMRGRGTST